MVFPVSCPLGKSEAVHQANRSMEKDCLVIEVWSGATEGCVCDWNLRQRPRDSLQL